MAGEGEALNTNAVWGQYGIYECSATLRQHGIAVPERAMIYAANHYRAILDMIYKSVKQKRLPDHIELDSWLDSDHEKSILFTKLADLKSFLDGKEWQILTDWLASKR